MTQQPNTGMPPDDATRPWTPPQPTVDVATAQPSPDSATPPPPFEDADDGPIVRPEMVGTEGGTFGAEAPSGGRRSGLRWAVALGGVGVVIAATIAIVALASGRPATSIAVGYMPDGTIQYSEYRLDLPGDQRQKLAAFMAHFPGFDDQAIFDTKLDEVLDRLLTAASKGEQTWTADIKPWFGGVVAMGSSPFSAEALQGVAAAALGGVPTVVVTITDAAAATTWVQEIAGEGATSRQYGDATLIGGGGGAGGGAEFSVGINDEVMIAGLDAAVRAAIDSKGDGRLADDDEFKAAFGTVGSDYVAFGYTEYQAYLRSLLNLATGSGSPLDTTTVDDELLAMVPAWQAFVYRVEADAIVGESTFPSLDFGFDAANKRSGLAGHVPPGTILYAEMHDVGAALAAFLGRLREMPDLRDTFTQVDQTAGMIGGIDGLTGWWGDVGLAVTPGADGTIGGGLLIAPTDAEAASDTFATLRSFAVLGGGQVGLAVRDVQHGDATITVIDFSEAAGGATDLPPGYEAEIAYAVSADIVAIGYGEEWVKSVLDAGPGPSLAEDDRYESLLDRVGEENLGVTFADITAIRELIEPLARSELPADQWAAYEREVAPYLLPFDALVAGSRKDGELDRMPQAITVK
jgi:hypothetical protein